MLSTIVSKFSLSSDPLFLSSFKFESCLGHGGFGIVMKASSTISTSKLNGRAIKFIFQTDLNDKERQQVLRECTVATKFSHKNIVQVLKVTMQKFNANEIQIIFKNLSSDDERSLAFRDTCVGRAKRCKIVEPFCIEMELCGENLRNWLNEGHDRNEANVKSLIVKINYDLVTGLKYLHDNKIIHRDLKPENVMFSRTGFCLPIKIGDFGLCRCVHSPESRTNTLTSRAGTTEYMAFEAFTHDYSFQTDLFSLGLVIWEIFQFIKFSERKKFFSGLVYDQIENLTKIPESMVGVKEMIINLTKKDQADRIKQVDEIVETCENLLSNIAKPTGGDIEYVNYNKQDFKFGSGSRSNLYEVEHLATFQITKNLVNPSDAMRMLDHMEINGFGIWAHKMKIRIDGNCLAVLDYENMDVSENFPLRLIRDPLAFTKTKPGKNYNNKLAFVVANVEIHVFQCLNVRADVMLNDLKLVMVGKELTPFQSHKEKSLDITPQLTSASLPANVDNLTEVLEGTTVVIETQLKELVGVLNQGFDDIERFIARLQYAAAAYRELQRRKTLQKSEIRHGDGLLKLRTRPPSLSEFIEILKTFKHSFNLLATLKSYIHDPNSPELVHFLFTPLSLIVDASWDAWGKEFPGQVVSPPLSAAAIRLLEDCLTSKETELWYSLGNAWHLSSNEGSNAEL